MLLNGLQCHPSDESLLSVTTCNKLTLKNNKILGAATYGIFVIFSCLLQITF